MLWESEPRASASIAFLSSPKSSYFCHHYYNFMMFRDVPRCSGMFNVRALIDNRCSAIRCIALTGH